MIGLFSKVFIEVEDWNDKFSISEKLEKKREKSRMEVNSFSLFVLSLEKFNQIKTLKTRKKQFLHIWNQRFVVKILVGISVGFSKDSIAQIQA